MADLNKPSPNSSHETSSSRVLETTASQFEELAEEEADRVQLLEKTKVFSVLENYFAQSSVLVKVTILQLLIIVALVISGGYMVLRVNEVTASLIQQSRAVSQYLYEQELQNIRTFGARVSASYFSLSYYNFDEVYSDLSPLFAPTQSQELNHQLLGVRELAQKGKIIQYPLAVDYKNLTVAADQVIDENKVYFMKIPVKIAISKASDAKKATYTAMFGLYVMKGEPTVGNPQGFQIYKMGVLQDSE
jgi:hypothetical protein